MTSSVTDRLVITDANGNQQLYTGPMPDYPFDTGDAISIGFDAIVPTGVLRVAQLSELFPGSSGAEWCGLTVTTGRTPASSATTMARISPAQAR